jgi:hypothetical protein
VKERERRVMVALRTWCIRGRGIFVYGRKCGVWKKEEDLRKKPWMDGSGNWKIWREEKDEERKERR